MIVYDNAFDDIVETVQENTPEVTTEEKPEINAALPSGLYHLFHYFLYQSVFLVQIKILLKHQHQMHHQLDIISTKVTPFSPIKTNKNLFLF